VWPRFFAGILPSVKYTAFIRGINVGGKVLIAMTDLKKLAGKAGFKDVKTILASGNVIFESALSAAGAEKKLETALREKYKRDIFVLVRTCGELEKLVALNPFKNIKVTQNTRLYVTFCREKPKGIKPQKHPGFAILAVNDREIFSILELSDKIKTPDVMKIMGKEIGITTMRNWNTVQKIIKTT
jgi:uncharacterized protein (DUF1697 family)